MKFFIAFALIVAVASGAVIKPTTWSAEQAQIQEIVAAIQSPSTDPATAALLEAMLMETLGLHPAPVAVGPAMVDAFEPIAVGPALVDMPVSVVDSVVAAPTPVPAIVAPAPKPPVAAPALKQPLVQIIVNVQSESSDAVTVDSPVAAPAIVPEVVAPAPTPVALPAPAPVVLPAPAPAPVVLPAPVAPEVIEAVQVVDSVPTPVQVVDIVPETVQVVDMPAPAPVVLPAPAINLPEILN